MKITLNSSNVDKSFVVKLLQGFLLMAMFSSVSADDTEIFYTENAINSNVLFVMDNSGSMTEPVPGTAADETVITVSYKIAGSADDAEEKPTNLISLYSSDLEMVMDGYNQQLVGLRFRGITVPKNAEIISAHIQFTADEDPNDKNSSYAKLQIQVQRDDDAGAFSYTKSDISNRNLYNETIVWEPTAWNEVSERGAPQKTPSLKNIVQLVTSRAGWSKNNAIVFVITGEGNRSAQSYNNTELSPPELTITYRETGEKSRMQVMQSALKTVLKDAPTNLSVGIMNYGNTTGWRRNHPNGVKFPVSSVNTLARPIVEKSLEVNGVPDWSFNNIPEPVGDVTVRTFLSEIADSWEPKGMTPIVDALYEAALYYRGDPIYRGYAPATKIYAAHPATYTTPAPSLIEPIQATSEKVICGGTYNKTIYDYAWDDRLTRWLAGSTESYKCPLDPSNPSELTSSGANCAATKFDCDVSEPYPLCTDWVPAVTERVCTGVDEDGNETGCYDNVITAAYCRNDVWSDPVTDSWCSFKVCKTVSTPIPAPEYKTPTVSDCQSNNIILMSDGKPEYLTDRAPYAVSRIKTLMGTSCIDKPDGFNAGRCGSELTHYLAENDINPGLTGEQTIDTFVIGFSSGISESASRYLESLVTVKDDPDTSVKEGFFSAQNEEQLAAAFTQTLDSIAEEARSQASPGYSVNVKSGLEHEDDIYIPVFDKSRGAVWSGNLKKFKLIEEGDHRFIRGKVTLEGDPNASGYINAMTELGLFRDDAWDEFSEHTIPDGNVVAFGGTAALLTNPAIRNLYSNVGVSNNLSASDNELNLANDALTGAKFFDAAKLSLGTKAAADYRDKLVNFIRGWHDGYYDPNAGLGPGWYNGGPNGIYHGNRPNYARWHMGDMLHSEPVVITYAPATADTAKKQYIFAATNEGYLHAFDSTTGMEQFAFMPEELLKNIEHQYVNEGEHRYGVDGSISYHHNDDNHDGIVNGDEKVLLFFGMRRGGSAYYALDVTDMGDLTITQDKTKGLTSSGRKPEPKLLWRIDENTAGFSRLGQSWSMPYIAEVMVGSTRTVAVIFTGGNDPAQDYGKGDAYIESSVTTDIPSSMGDDIYIVNANTGSLLWNMRDDVSGASGAVTHALPGGAKILDVNRNGLLDRLYFADTGGFVWRLDLDEDLGSTSVLTKFASLGGTGANARKFYNEPDIAIIGSGRQTRFSVSIGSGLRPHPLNEEIKDYMFVLLDEKPYLRMPTNCADCTIEINDLESISIDTNSGAKQVLKSSDFEGKKITETDKRGWYVGFTQPGEKILASSITFEGSIVFTTLVPEVLTRGEGITICAAPATQGRVYAMDLLTGEASMNLDNSVDEKITDNDVSVTISASEIPGTPQTVFNKLVCEGGTCKHDVDLRIGKKSTEAGSSNVSEVESVYWNVPE